MFYSDIQALFCLHNSLKIASLNDAGETSDLAVSSLLYLMASKHCRKTWGTIQLRLPLTDMVM